MTSKVGLISLPFAGGYYREKSRAFSDERLINWYVNYPDKPGINEYRLLPCPGIVEHSLYFGTDPVFRGAYIMNGKLYAVYEGRLFRIDYSGGVYTSTDLTTPPNFIVGTGRVIMAAIKNQLVIVVPGVGAHHYTEGGALVQITDAEFLIPDSVVAIDTYFVFQQTGTNVVFSSILNDGLNYAALDRYIVSQIQVGRGLVVYRNQLYVIGDGLIVPFSNQAQAQFAFRPIPSAAMDYGLESKFLVAKVRFGVVFVGRTVNSCLSVWLYSSGAPQQISTGPIDDILSLCSDSEISAAYLMTYKQAGTECLALTIPFVGGENGYCFVYDFTASAKSGKPEWHERRAKVGVQDLPWQVSEVVGCYGKNILFGGSVSPGIGVFDGTIGTEYGIRPRRVFNTQPYSMLGVNTKVKSLEIYTDVGVDDNSQLTASWSDDGGFNYGNKISRSTGAIGQYNTRVIWDQLGGFSRQRMLQVEYTGEYPRAINKIMANIE